MSRLLTAYNGALINSDHIVSIRDIKPPQDNPPGMRPVWRGEAKLQGHDDRVILLDNTDTIEEMMSPVVPANPGFQLITFLGDEDDPLVTRDPIIAWRIVRNYYVTPITLDKWDREFEGILLPDGRVLAQEDQWFESEESWLRTMMERKKKRKAT